MNKAENMQESGIVRKEGTIVGGSVEIAQKGLGTYLTITALGFIVVLLLGALFDALTARTGTHANTGIMNEELASLVATKLTFYNLARLFDAFIPLFFFALTAGVGLFVKTAPALKYLSRVGVLFMSVYAPISVVVYVAQYTTLSIMLKDASTRAALWPFWSLVIPSMSYLAYAICGIGVLLIAVGLIGERGVRRWGGWSLILMGIFCLLAFSVEVVFGLGLALLILWTAGLAGVSFAVAMIVSTKTELSSLNLSGRGRPRDRLSVCRSLQPVPSTPERPGV